MKLLKKVGEPIVQQHLVTYTKLKIDVTTYLGGILLIALNLYFKMFVC